jgi:hypothetical protein
VTERKMAEALSSASAFPRNPANHVEGMTFREYAAVAILAALANRPSHFGTPDAADAQEAATAALAFADALIARMAQGH